MVKKLLTSKVICWWSQQWQNLIYVTLDMVLVKLNFKCSLTILKWNRYVSCMKPVKHPDFRRTKCLIVFSPAYLLPLPPNYLECLEHLLSLSTWQIMGIQKSLLNKRINARMNWQFYCWQMKGHLIEVYQNVLTKDYNSKKSTLMYGIDSNHLVMNISL